MPKLVLKQLNKVFNQGTINETQVTNNFSLSLQRGEFVSIIGSNGAGKSTLMNLIAGKLFPTSGTITLNNADITAVPASKRATDISRVFQDPRLGSADNLSIEENLAVAERRGQSAGFRWGLSKQKRQIFRDQLAQLSVGLEERLNVPAAALSGGQRQALTLLMATLHTPEVLLLDEHTAALDPAMSERIMTLTDKIVTKNAITTLMITHNMQDAIHYGNRLIMLHHGQKVLDVSGEEKQSLTVERLTERFEKEMGESLTDDELLLR
ncbi:MAG: ATP-binding cassette domain-containing protein [Aerococcus sp.]|nr:ATP-binding cassette domain-containing protein [Aerococcus sp.]